MRYDDVQTSLVRSIVDSFYFVFCFIKSTTLGIIFAQMKTTHSISTQVYLINFESITLLGSNEAQSEK